MRGFDLIILSDLVFNHSQVSHTPLNYHSAHTHVKIIDNYNFQHVALLKSCLEALAPYASNQPASSNAPAPTVLVFYSHHIPKYADRDLRFFTEALERGWVCEEMEIEKFPVGSFIFDFFTWLDGSLLLLWETTRSAGFIRERWLMTIVFAADVPRRSWV